MPITSPRQPESIARGEHVNVPTLVADKLPEAMQLLGELFAFVEHGRPIRNVAHSRRLHEGLARADREAESKRALLGELVDELAQIKDKKKRQRHQRRIDGLRASRPKQGLRLKVLCTRTHNNGRQEDVHLSMAQVLGVEAIARPGELAFEGALVRQGKTTLHLALTPERRELLAALHITQALPHLFRGLPLLYASCFALARDHARAHELPAGTFFYARHGKTTERKYAPTLMLARRGYDVGNQNAARTIHLQVELLRSITLSGEHAGQRFKDVPLLVESTRFHQAHELPAGVRAGVWSTLTIPEAMWSMQSKAFVQLPEALLETHDLYAANLGLVLKAREAYAGGREAVGEQGQKLELDRLLDQAGFRQPFRACPSRDRELLARGLGDLEAMGFVTHITTEELEEMCSEPVPRGQETDKPAAPRDGVRRRFPGIKSHRKVYVHLYTRVLIDPLPPPDTQGLLIPSG